MWKITSFFWLGKVFISNKFSIVSYNNDMRGSLSSEKPQKNVQT